MRQAVERIREAHQDARAQTLPPEVALPPVGCCRCNQPSWVMVRCDEAKYAAFLCANDVVPVVEFFQHRKLRYTIAPLASSRHWGHVLIGGNDVELYVKATFDGVIGDAGLPFEDAEIARLAIEAQLHDRLGRHLDRGEQILVAAAVSIEWQRRDRLAREEAAHSASEWLYDFSQGGAR
jgi:hypothetical protein